MRRTVLAGAASLLAVVLTWSVPATASSRVPVKEVTSFAVTETFPEGVCGFPVRFRVVGRTTTRIFLDADGQVLRARSTGPITIRFTRTDTGVSVRYAVAGPSFYDADLTLVRGTGPWFVFTAAGTPAIAIGNLTFDEVGVPQDPAHLVDVCAALA